ncbi:ferrous iron transport protein B [Anaerosalibacter bizertensis]|uniref:Ferrous iron transport protein B n=1 Tax=Anaerosalibacter bizertensis TaxID=932217 RepID=A0A9Q4ABY5_9FIRM|nr:ferrous iron transport protein B [Anaerosalibacter bizertensis]MCB5558911.1 ferrous iron transport protein B [Anaerosalibacter bizertensis]MCG4564856.1 ferrous iron transport protein B [Anaerosalibacter bizertensis]
MGLTHESSGLALVKDEYIIEKEIDNTVIALAGNPNTGKSTLFNYLTGLKQHTGNWPGKTVANAKGTFNYEDESFLLVDLPGTYSIFANSQEEEIARNFICFGEPEITVVVVDSTSLERNLNLVLQIMEITDNVVVSLNLIDEAKRKGIKIDIGKLENELGVPIVPTVARDGIGVEKILNTIYNISNSNYKIDPHKVKYSPKIENTITKIENILSIYMNKSHNLRWIALRLIDGDKNIKNELGNFLIENGFTSEPLEEIENIIKENENIGDEIVTTIYENAEQIADEVVSIEDNRKIDWDKKLDDILTNKITGYPIMLILLGLIFWITIVGANYPSELLAKILFGFENKLSYLFLKLNPPDWLYGILILGVYRTLAWVISVMLPPMAIFFPLFTLLEDLGYLPRVAFNLDNSFRKAGTHGKQALTMSMGFGCNAAGIMACRIIDSPRERLIAIITNNFVPCNGRFPIIIAMSTIFIGGLVNEKYSSIIAAISVVFVVLIGIFVTLTVSRFLSKTFLKGVPSSFTLELPPYRKPQIGKILIRSLIDRTLFVLSRAIMVAIPAGAITWIFANITINGASILNISANFLDPFAKLLGLDGYILMAFILGLPANEIVLPILTMSYMSKGAMLEFESIETLKNLLSNNGWTFITGLNFMLFSLLHFPCGTTLLTIKKETGGRKWSIFTFFLTTIVAILVTFIVNIIGRLVYYLI